MFPLVCEEPCLEALGLFQWLAATAYFAWLLWLIFTAPD
jgi:hypothetical protein